VQVDVEKHAIPMRPPHPLRLQKHEFDHNGEKSTDWRTIDEPTAYSTHRCVDVARNSSSCRRNDAFAGQPFRYGSRVPCLCVGPYAKPNVSAQQNSHVSLLKFCEDVFGLDPLTARNAASNGMSDCVDSHNNHAPAPQLRTEH
jgi:phospholipase C